VPEGLPIDESADELYEHAPCGYLTLDAEGRTSRVNATFLAWTGLDRDAVVGRPFTDLLTAGGRLFHETHVAPLLRLQGLAREVALDVACPAGTLPVLLNAAARRDADGGLREVRMVLLDARERRSYERELLRARRRAERLARLGAPPGP